MSTPRFSAVIDRRYNAKANSKWYNMMTTAKLLAAAVIALLWAADPPHGAVGAETAAPASAGLLNDWVRQQDDAMRAWDFGGEFRLRYEDYENAVRAASSMTSVPSGTKPLTMPVNPNTDFIARGQPNSSDDLLTRVKFHAGWSPTPWCTVYAEMRNSTSDWDQRSPAPDEDTGALQQAYIALGDPAQFPLVAKNRPAGIGLRRPAVHRQQRLEQSRPDVRRRQAAVHQ